MEALILAGGFGTRLKDVIDEIPKPMAQINGIPFLSYLFEYLLKYGVERVILCTGHLSEKIEEFYGSKYKELLIAYSHETEPLGTGGAIHKALKLAMSETVFILNGDTFFDVNLSLLNEQHNSKQSDFTFALKPMKDFDRYGCININNNGEIIEFEEKKHRLFGYINGGIYILRKDIFTNKNLSEKFSLENDFFEKYLNEVSFYGYISDTYFIDIGIPEDYYKAQKDLVELYEIK